MNNVLTLTPRPLQRPEGTALPEEVSLALDNLFGLRATDTTQLMLVNHAEPQGAATRNGAINSPALTEKGRCQAMRLAMRLRSTQIDAVYTSTAPAALETALLVASSKDLPMTRMPQLLEIALHGRSTGRFGSDVKKAAAEAQARFINKPRWDALYGFEPSRQFRHRVVQAIEGIIARHSGQTVVVVTHLGVINAYLSMVLDIGRDMFFLPEHTSISDLRIHEDLYALQNINDVAHLLTTFSPQ